MSLMDELREAATPPPPSGFKPGIRYSGAKPSEVVTPWLDHELPDGDYSEVIEKMGVPLPPGHTLSLVEARFNQAAWHRDQQDTGTKDSAYTAPMWIYRFKVVPISLRADDDLAVLEKEARRAVRGRRLTRTIGGTMIVDLADPQTGKTDELGGTPELLERMEIALAKVQAQIRKVKPEGIILVDLGDSTEGFESAPNADRTNDLQQVEQIRVWRRIFWRWITALSGYTDDFTVVSVPSNHCSVRRGKNKMGPADDDWGLEVLSQVSDMAEVNPEAYGHIQFVVPRKHEHHVTLPVQGKIVTFVHGHDVGNPKNLTEWAKRHGRRDIGVSDIVNVGHFHRLSIECFGDSQWLFVSPTMDGGSSWYTPLSGERSDPGVLTYVVDENGWRDLYVAWAN